MLWLAVRKQPKLKPSFIPTDQTWNKDRFELFPSVTLNDFYYCYPSLNVSLTCMTQINTKSDTLELYAMAFIKTGTDLQ